MPHKPTIAVYPGSFDPITYGHLDIIVRSAGIFDELIVGIGLNPDKRELFTQQERLELIAPHIRRLTNVRAEAYTGLTIDFVQRCRASIILRGIRDAADLNSELQQANLNRMVGGAETMFLSTSDQYALTSSTYIKQFYIMGGGNLQRIERLVPPNVARALAGKLGPGRGGIVRRSPARRRRRSRRSST